MKPILDQATAPKLAGNSSFGTPSVPLGRFQPSSASRAVYGFQLPLPPSTDRRRPTARARRVAVPASGLGGDLDKQISRLKEANREWLAWRFGDDD